MKRILFTAVVLVLLAALIVGAQTHTFPALDTNNAFTGINTMPQLNGEIWYDGVKYTTVQAAMTAANTGGNGIVHVGCGTFTGPTTFYSSVAVISTCPTQYFFPGGFGQTVPPQVGTFLTYTANLSISSVSNSKLDGVVLDFGNNGAGIVFGNSFTSNDWPNVAIVRCGNATTDCIAWNVTSTGAANNANMNHFGNLFINPNQGTNLQANCMTMQGVGPVNAGGFVTDNRFDNFVCSGGIRNGLVFRINTDTNFFGRAFINFFSPTVANTGCLVLNDVTPNTDQDSDGGTIDQFVCQNAPTQFRLGATNGWVVKMTQGSGGFPTFTNLGTGTPLITVQTIGLPGVNSDLTAGGRISASGIPGVGPATGSTAGDITAARAATQGAVYLGTDGSVLFRSGNTASFGYGTVTATFPAATGTLLNGFRTSVAGSTTLLAANSCGDTVTVTVTGATASMDAHASGTISAGLIERAWVSSANTVSVQYCNVTTAGITPSAATLQVTVIQ